MARSRQCVWSSCVSGWTSPSGIEAAYPLVINAGVLRAQYVVDHAVALAPAGGDSLYDVLAQLHIERIGLANMAEGVTA